MDANNKSDQLRNLFRKLPEESLPVDFRTKMMQQIMVEAQRVKKRNERLALMAIILASIAILGLCVGVLIYIGIPKISLSIPSVTSMSFYLYIGVLALLLLWGDYAMRKRYKEKHKE